MKLIRCPGYEEMSSHAAQEILERLQRPSTPWLCAATGYSPRGTYRKLIEHFDNNPGLFATLGIVKLDEWWGVPPGAEGSCEAYLRDELLSPLDIPPERYISFNSEATDPQEECQRVQEELAKHGPVDICLLGLGKNGHLGLNEPSGKLLPNCHVSWLSEQSREHAMLGSLAEKPALGLTLGMADILQAKKIILLVCGDGKNDAFEAFMKKEIDLQLPVSLLWLHPDVSCFLDTSAVS